mgnify:CR=1 FL=1
MSEWSFEVPGTPAPWTVGQRGGGRRNPRTGEWEQSQAVLRMHQWQTAIQIAALEYWWADGRREPLKGLVRLRLSFYLPRVKESSKSQPGGKNRQSLRRLDRPPDLSNLQKAFEDSLQSIIYENDAQVAHIQSTKALTDEPEGFTVCWIDSLTQKEEEAL